MAGIAPCDGTQMRRLLGGDTYAAHRIMLCALGSGGIHVPAGMQWVQHYRRDMLMFVAMRQIHFDYISDIKF